MTDPTTLARVAAAQAYGDFPDHHLLERFAAERDEAAFASLVERYGRGVLDAALAILRHDQDAEDVFQAAFLVLARKAATIRKRDSIGCWLHGVARRIALKALRARSRRSRHELTNQPRQASGDELTWGEVRELVHAELARLPATLRAPLLLCYLEGLTQDEAAVRLGLPKGTLKGRLERGRETLRRRLARSGLALSAITFPVTLARAVPPLTVLATARYAVRFVAGAAGEIPVQAVELANGVLRAMTSTSLKIGLLVAVTTVTVALGVGAARTDSLVATDPAPRAAAPLAPAVAPPPAAVAKIEFEEVTIVVKPGGPSNRTRETIRVSADGTCLYEVPERPARGEIPAWPGAKIVHKLSPERLRELNELLKGTDWLGKDAKAVMQLHQSEYDLALKRDGKTVSLTIKGESEAYAKLLHFFRSVAAQEYILYRLEWVPAAQVEGRRELDDLVAAELGEPFAKPPLTIDLARFTPWATRLVRNPFEQPTDDVRTAVRLAGWLKLESEREYLADLATDRERRVRVAVAVAIGRLGGEKAIPVLRKLVRSTGEEAAWELIKLGPIAVPTIAEVIREGTGEEDLSYEWLIRVYLDHWKDVPKPLDAKIVDAVRASMAVPKVKAMRTEYHKQFLKLVAELVPANPLDRPVSLTADKMPLKAALQKIAADAGLEAEFDVEALKKAEFDLEEPVSVKFENVPLARAISQLIDWNGHPGILREVRRAKLVFTTLEAWQARIAERLPEWMKPLYNQGLLATLDDNDDVVTVTASVVVTDELLAKFKTLPQLRELHIEVTKGITPAGLAHLAKLPRLEKLSLYSVNADGPGLGDDAIRSLVGLESLRDLSIAQCGTTDAGAKLLEKLPQLTSLSLGQEGRLTDEALKSVAKLPRLKSLSLASYVGTERLGRMQFSATGIRQLKGLKELESLHLVGHVVPADALDFPKLTSLSLGHFGVGDAVAAKVGELRELRYLELSYCRIGDAGLKHIATLPELRSFDISSATITDAGIGHFRAHKRLEHVTLRATDLTDKSLEHLAQIESVTRLDLYGSGQSGVAPGRNFGIAGLQQLKKLPKLDALWLTNFDIPGGGYVGLKELKHLRELTFMMSNITGEEVEALEKALPRARISSMSGGTIQTRPKPVRK